MHLSGDVLHLLAAGVWIGALVPLSMLVLHSVRTGTDASAKATYRALERFSGIGPAIVAILILTGLVNSWFLIGLENWRELFTTAYGLALIVKLVLFGGMLLLAAANRFWLSPRLGADLTASQSVTEALRALRISIFTETVLAGLVLATVALFGTLEPPIAA
jgi:putative copper resistance protein D